MRRWLGALLLAAPVACAGPVGSTGGPASFPPPRTAQEADARLAFLAQRLDAGRAYARAWWWGWLATDSVGVATSLRGSVAAVQGDERAFNIVQAAQSTLGLLDVVVLRPMPGRAGAAPMRTAAAAGASVDEQIATGERLLLAAAQRAEERRDWRLHAANLGLQALGTGLLLGLDYGEYAGISFAIGMVGGEVSLWSEPWRATGDLAAYRRLVAAGDLPPAPKTSWRLAPREGGVALELRY